MTIGDRIKARREELGMTQLELALKIGYKNKSSVNKIETGVQNLKQSKIKEIADALQTTPAYIMGWDDENDPSQDEGYYYNQETASIAQAIYEDKDMRLLFDTARDSRPEDLQMVAGILKQLKEREKGTQNDSGS